VEWLALTQYTPTQGEALQQQQLEHATWVMDWPAAAVSSQSTSDMTAAEHSKRISSNEQRLRRHVCCGSGKQHIMHENVAFMPTAVKSCASSPTAALYVRYLCRLVAAVRRRRHARGASSGAHPGLLAAAASGTAGLLGHAPADAA
jgi:hypothetical protein